MLGPRDENEGSSEKQLAHRTGGATKNSTGGRSDPVPKWDCRLRKGVQEVPETSTGMTTDAHHRVVEWII